MTPYLNRDIHGSKASFLVSSVHFHRCYRPWCYSIDTLRKERNIPISLPKGKAGKIYRLQGVQGKGRDMSVRFYPGLPFGEPKKLDDVALSGAEKHHPG